MSQETLQPQPEEVLNSSSALEVQPKQTFTQKAFAVLDKIVKHKSELPPDDYAGLIEEVSKAMTGR